MAEEEVCADWSIIKMEDESFIVNDDEIDYDGD